MRFRHAKRRRLEWTVVGVKESKIGHGASSSNGGGGSM